MKIGPYPISRDHAPLVVAEMSGNHGQSLDRALQIVDAAAASGAHGLKLQTYTAETMTLPVGTGEFHIDDEASLWQGYSLHELYRIAQTPSEWHAPIIERATALGLVAFSTPFDETAIELLEDLDIPCYKVASFENGDLPLIREIAATGKPVMISTGLASLAELDETVRTLREGGCKDIVLLKCTSTYPATPQDSNLNTIPHLRDLFRCEVGLSDHTLGIGAGIAAVALGATVIEKHFTLDRADGGVDSAFSMEPNEMAALVTETKRAWQALGSIHYGPTEAEKPSLRYRQSYIANDVIAGELLTRDNLRVVRPGNGHAPKYDEQLLGKRVNRDLAIGTAMEWRFVG